MQRYSVFALCVIATLASLVAMFFWWPAAILLAVFAAATALGVWDLIQTRHAVLRNYPVIGHMRWIFEGIRPEIRQYIIESDEDEEPFSREYRSLVYQRAKNVEDKQPFGTHEHVYEPGYAWLCHSMAPRHITNRDFRVRVGGPDCQKPYDISLFNISAMSFGALSGNAIRALNEGARAGGFAHDTGEGGISRYHKAGGGDLIYQVGTGYFGCCEEPGTFSAELFASQASAEQVKMIEIKLSQGAKPGHGGVLPAAKLSEEIAEARGISRGRDCVSPSGHSAFSTPVELLAFVQQLRTLSGGKPTGFKLCIGHRHEFMAVVKAMIETGITPDFVVVDGAEGGTGAAPVEFTDHIGEPLIDGLTFVHNTLVAAGIRDKIRIGASGKIVSAFDIIRTCALGADWCNSARGFMFALGCIQAQACHTNSCPTGIATQDGLRQRSLVVADKAQRVRQFHGNTLKVVAEMLGAAGLASPREISLEHFRVRRRRGDIITGQDAFRPLLANALLDGTCTDPAFTIPWSQASAHTFAQAPGAPPQTQAVA